jgi:hypothetical protein
MINSLCDIKSSLESLSCRKKQVEDRISGCEDKVEAGGVTQVVACLISKHESLSSNPNTAKKTWKTK